MKQNQKIILFSVIAFAVVVLCTGTIAYYLFFHEHGKKTVEKPAYFRHFEKDGDIKMIIVQNLIARTTVHLEINATIAKNDNGTVEINDKTGYDFTVGTNGEMIIVHYDKKNVTVDVLGGRVKFSEFSLAQKDVKAPNVTNLKSDANNSATVNVTSDSITVKSTFVTIIIETGKFSSENINAKGPKNETVKITAAQNSSVFKRRDSDDLYIVSQDTKGRNFVTKIEPKLWKITGSNDNSDGSENKNGSQRFSFTPSDIHKTVVIKTNGIQLSAVPKNQREAEISTGDRIVLKALSIAKKSIFDRFTIDNGTEWLHYDSVNNTMDASLHNGMLKLDANEALTVAPKNGKTTTVDLKNNNETLNDGIEFNINGEKLSVSSDGCFVKKHANKIEKVFTPHGLLAKYKTARGDEDVTAFYSPSLGEAHRWRDGTSAHVYAHAARNYLEFDGERVTVVGAIDEKAAELNRKDVEKFFNLQSNIYFYAALQMTNNNFFAIADPFAIKVENRQASLKGPWGIADFQNFEFPEEGKN